MRESGRRGGRDSSPILLIECQRWDAAITSADKIFLSCLLDGSLNPTGGGHPRAHPCLWPSDWQTHGRWRAAAGICAGIYGRAWLVAGHKEPDSNRANTENELKILRIGQKRPRF